MPVVPTLLALALAGCDPGDAEGARPEVSVSAEIGTVATVRWNAGGDSAEAEWRSGGGDWTQVVAEKEGDGGWMATLFGLRASSDFEVRVVGDDQAESTSFSTGPLPEGVEGPVVTEDAGINDGYFSLGIISSTPMGAILDGGGNPVWWWAIPASNLLSTRVTRSVDQRSVLVSSFQSIDASVVEGLAIYRVAYDGTVLEVIDTPNGHHDFVERSDGTLAWLSFETREQGLWQVRGDTLVERAPDGTTREVWNAWDWFAWEDYEEYGDVSFVHANTVKFDEATGTYWVGLRAANCIVRVDPVTGDIVERILGVDSSFELQSGLPMSYQHSFSLLPDGGFVVHDNRMRPSDSSRVVEYGIDRDAGTLEQRWQFVSDEELHVTGLGDAIRTPEGDTIALWSSAGEIQRVNADGETLWRANADIGNAYAYLQWTTDPQVYGSPTAD